MNKRSFKIILFLFALTLLTIPLKSFGANIKEDKVYLVASGDNLIHSTVYNKCEKNGKYDFNDIYKYIKDYIKKYDIAVINQETIFIDDNSKISSYPTFGTPQSMGEAVVNAGFNTILSATNHTFDKGMYGIETTLKYWKENYSDVNLLGIHETIEDYENIDIIEKNNIKIAMFNYTYGLNGFSLPKDEFYRVNLLSDKEKFLNDLKKAEDLADISICFVHIGEEYRYTPTDYQKNYIKDLIDAGADIIICAHPHVIEPVEYVETNKGNKALVYYSLGNFISGQTELDRNLGGLASIEITKKDNITKVTDYSFIPVVTHRTSNDIKAYLLEDYNNNLASKHSVSGITIEKLCDKWKEITGENINYILDKKYKFEKKYKNISKSSEIFKNEKIYNRNDRLNLKRRI